MKVQTASVAAALMLAAAGQAAYAADATGWEYVEKPNAHVVYTSATDTPGLALVCTDQGKMTAAVSLDAGNMLEKITDDSDRTRKKSGELTVGDESERISWTYRPATQLVTPKDGKYSRRIFNAAVTGALVTVNVSYKDAVQLDLPSVDAAFTEFAQSCAATSAE